MDRLGKDNVLRYQKLLSDLAQPYHLYGSEVVANPPHRTWAINAREGLITTVCDLAKYDAALDRHWLLRQETQERAWTPAVSNGGQAPAPRPGLVRAELPRTKAGLALRLLARTPIPRCTSRCRRGT